MITLVLEWPEKSVTAGSMCGRVFCFGGFEEQLEMFQSLDSRLKLNLDQYKLEICCHARFFSTTFFLPSAKYFYISLCYRIE